MPYLERTRVGRSQAASIFWGLVSVFFAGAACYYYWKDRANDTSNDVLRDQVLTLQEDRDSLNSQKDKLQASIAETESQLKTREDFLQDKESKLAEEETRLEGLAEQSQAQADLNEKQAEAVKKFNDAVRKLANGDSDVVVRDGRPVLRVPDSSLFVFGSPDLKPEGKALLTQLAQALDGQLGDFELRLEIFTDNGESHPEEEPTQQVDLNAKPDDKKKTPPPKPPPLAPPPEISPWQLSGERAGTVARFFHDETSLPFPDLVVVPRANFGPIEASGTEGHARNRRTEITLEPAPAPFVPPDSNTDDATAQDNPAAKTTPAHPGEKAAKSKKDKGDQAK